MIDKKFTHADLCDTQAKLITKLEQELEWVKDKNERLIKERFDDALRVKNFTHESFNAGNNPLFNKEAETDFDKDPIGARVIELRNKHGILFYHVYDPILKVYSYHTEVEDSDFGVNSPNFKDCIITRVINKDGFEFEVGQETSRGKIINFCIDSIMKTNVCANLNTGLVIGATYFNIDELTPNK